MWHDVRAEAIVQSRRPALWIVMGIAVALTITFGYLVPAMAAGANRAALVAVQRAPFSGVAIGGTPVFVGALMLVAGVLIVGSEYEWRTWKSLLGQGSSRGSVLAGKLSILVGAAAVMTVVLLAASAATTQVIAWVTRVDPVWPPVVDVVAATGTGLLVTTMWGALGVLLSIWLRGVALPIGLGLVWILAVQNLITGVAAPLLAVVADAQRWLPGPAVGSLAAFAGAPAGAPGVGTLVAADRAALVTAGYVLVFTVLAWCIFERRDVD